jgi:hypothetical protein
MTIATTARNAGLQDLVTMLREQHVRKVDMVVPASALRSVDGQVQVSGVEPILLDDGVQEANGLYAPTQVFDEGLSDKLDIPLKYVRRLRESRPDLMDANVNGWLRGRGATMEKGPDWDGANPGAGWVEKTVAIPGDSRSFMLRTFRSDDDSGIARALLSNSYSIVDNLDVLMEALGAVREAGVEAYVDRANLTERRMSVEIVVPEIEVLATELLRGYRNPFGSDFERWRGIADREGLGYGGEEPVVWAGFKITNSETGGGAFTITPQAKVKVCANGLTLSNDVVRAVHLGGRLETGVVNWSAETQRQNLELIKAKTRDAVATFIDIDYMTAAIAKITEKAMVEVGSDEVKVITKRAKFTEPEQDMILDFFIRGGQTTRGGIMQAVTAASQMVDDADQAHDMEAKALAVLTA